MIKLYEVIKISEESAKTEEETRSIVEKSKENEKFMHEWKSHNHGNDTDRKWTAPCNDSTNGQRDNVKQISTDVNSTKSPKESFKTKKPSASSKPGGKKNENVSSKVGEGVDSNDDGKNVISKWMRNVTLSAFHDVPMAKKLERCYSSKPKYGNPAYCDPVVLSMGFEDRVHAIKKAHHQALT